MAFDIHIPCWAGLGWAGLGWAVLCCAVLCCAGLCCAVLCCAGLCCAVLCCAGIPERKMTHHSLWHYRTLHSTYVLAQVHEISDFQQSKQGKHCHPKRSSKKPLLFLVTVHIKHIAANCVRQAAERQTCQLPGGQSRRPWQSSPHLAWRSPQECTAA